MSFENLKPGGILKVEEEIPHDKLHRKRITIGEITSIDLYKVNLVRLHQGEKRNNTSFNIADFKDKKKKFFIKKGNEWQQILIKVTEHCKGKGV
jgi:hypothetical protein